jgi:hypothetical protein
VCDCLSVRMSSALCADRTEHVTHCWVCFGRRDCDRSTSMTRRCAGPGAISMAKARRKRSAIQDIQAGSLSARFVVCSRLGLTIALSSFKLNSARLDEECAQLLKSLEYHRTLLEFIFPRTPAHSPLFASQSTRLQHTGIEQSAVQTHRPVQAASQMISILFTSSTR